MRRRALACILLSIWPLASISAIAQLTGSPTLNLVEPIGPGRIVISFSNGAQLKTITLSGNVDQFFGADPNTTTAWWLEQKTKNPSIKDEGLTAAIQLVYSDGLNVTYSLFPNPVYLKVPSAPPVKRPEVCRDEDPSIMWVVSGQGYTNIDQLKTSSRITPNGQALAVASFLVKQGSNGPGKELDGFYYKDPLCAKARIAMAPLQPSSAAMMDAALDAFSFDPEYVPDSQDYLKLGTLLYRVTKSYAAAGIYYQRALDTLPANAPLNARRVIIDQLSMSYGISGQIKLSRAVNEAAIKADPDYPLYYYNLACADAEEGKAADAKTHLQQAFDRKANTLPGEHMPDPTQDDSIQKLKKNKEFWTFVQTLK